MHDTNRPRKEPSLTSDLLAASLSVGRMQLDSNDEAGQLPTSVIMFASAQALQQKSGAAETRSIEGEY